MNKTNKVWYNTWCWLYQGVIHALTNADKTATYNLYSAADTSSKLPSHSLWSTAVLYSAVSPTSLFIKAAEALVKSSRSRSLLGLDRWPSGDPQTKTGPKLLLIWTGTRLLHSANTITPSLRSFARPLAVHEFAISSSLVWWQLTSCKSRRGQWPPLWERLVTWPLMNRPNMYQARPNHGYRTRHNNAAQQAFWKKIMTPQAAQMFKTHVNIVPEWKLRRHL